MPSTRARFCRRRHGRRPRRRHASGRLDSDLTYESFDHGTNTDEHDNGQIWSATLREIWQALGRHVSDRSVIDSHFQLGGFTTFARGARAILDADRHLHGGRYAATLWRIFRRRGIGSVE